MIKTIIKINGMACGMCEAHVNESVRNFCNVKSVKSSYKKGITEITSEDELDIDGLRTAISDTGYTVISITTKET